MAGIGNDLVREARKRAGLTQRELAEKAGTTQSALARIETGRSTPSFDTVLRLVRLCGLDLDLMLVERDDSDWVQASRLLPLSAEDLDITPHRGAENLGRLAGALRALSARSRTHGVDGGLAFDHDADSLGAVEF